MNKKRKNDCTTLNYIEQVLFLFSAITGCISISAVASLLCIPVEITSCAIGSKNCAIAAGIKNYNSITKNKEKT